MHRGDAGDRRTQDQAVPHRGQGGTLLTTSGRVVLGLGGCIDHEITWGDAIVQQLADQHRLAPSDLDPAALVRDERDLVRSVLGFVRDGTGGERYVAGPEIGTSFAARFPHRTTLGGTNVRAALALSRLGLPSTLHLVSIDDTMRRLLPPDVDYVCSAPRDSVMPHLIVQYPAGVRVRVGTEVLCSPRPNRLIYVNDLPNREMALSRHLGRLVADARMFLISGFNSMQDAATLDSRLADLRGHMRNLPSDAIVVFEDAGYHVPDLSRRVVTGLDGWVDVHSMNEDELQTHVGRDVDLLDADDLRHALSEARRFLPARTLVVHTRFWALAFGEDVTRYRAALESATRTAAARYLHGDRFNRDHYEQMPKTRRHAAGTDLARRLEDRLSGMASCVPAYAPDTDTPTTVGLGDAFVGGFIAGFITTTLRP